MALKLAIGLLMVGGVTSFSILPSPATGIVRNDVFSSKPSSFAEPTPNTVGRSNVSKGCRSSTSLEAVPNWALYSLSHIIGGALGSPIVMRATRSWYKRFALPSWTPPNAIFGPVWSTLYGLMGYSVSRIVSSGSPSTNLATKLWTFHYALNIIWAPIFFGFKNLRTGLIINYGLIASLAYIMKLFHSIDPLSAYLQVPYMCWLIYATKLNQTVCKLNPTVDGVNRAMILADLYADGDEDGYNDELLQYDLKLLQKAAAEYAGL